MSGVNTIRWKLAGFHGSSVALVIGYTIVPRSWYIGSFPAAVIEGLSKVGISSGSYVTCESKGLGMEETLAHLMTEIRGVATIGGKGVLKKSD